MTIPKSPIRVLLIEDDEDDYIIIKESLSKITHTKYQITWVPKFEEAVKKAFDHQFDICLLDYRLGMESGLGILKELRHDHFNAPVIMLTGQGSRDLDLDAMNLGADDYVEKSNLNATLLERAIRYGIDRWHQMHQLRASEQKLRELSAKILRAQEDERKYLAKELHDSIGSNLTAIKFMIESNKSAEKKILDALDFSPDKIVSAIIQTIEETQRITKNLRPDTIDKLGLLASLNSLVRQFSEINPKVDVDTDFQVSEDSIPEPLKITIYRVAQEALNNVTKHSRATHTELCFSRAHNMFELLVIDNGVGMASPTVPPPSSANGSGLGLSAMQERVELTNGIFEIQSRPNKGTTIRATWIANGVSKGAQ